MHKHKRRITEDFSQRIDDVLAGKDAPVDDALLSLAAEIAGAPVLRPSPSFARQLRQKLLSSQASQPARSTWRWAVGTAVLTMVMAILLTLVWNPWSPPSAQEVLARVADAVSVQPGQIEHLVAHIAHEMPEANPVENLVQLWNRIEEMPDGSLAAGEQINLNYSPDDVELENPASANYWGTSGKWCALQYVEQQSIPVTMPGADENGCISHDLDIGPDPALGSMSSPQEWINSLEKARWEMDHRAYPDRLNGRPVYRLEGTSECWMIEINDTLIEKKGYACSMTLYIDRETYMLKGGASKPTSGPGVSQSYTLISYEVLDSEELGFDPFVWPPQQ